MVPKKSNTFYKRSPNNPSCICNLTVLIFVRKSGSILIDTHQDTTKEKEAFSCEEFDT